MSFWVKRFPLFCVIAALLLAPRAVASPVTPDPSQRWVCAWASAQMITEAPKAPPALSSSTLRELVRVTGSGSRIRLRLSNALGTEPVTIGGVHVARALSPQSPRIDPASDRVVTFGGKTNVTIPSGAEYISDPVPMRVRALSTLAVSMHFVALPQDLTGHPGSRATSYVVQGDQLGASDLQAPALVERWYFLTGVDVQRDGPAKAVAVLGDSITDGHGVKTDSDTRWTDFLAERLSRVSGRVSHPVLNLGIGGNRVVTDGLGPNALARFDRDILERSGVRYLIILEGVNDIGVLTREAPASPDEHRILVDRILGAYRQMVARAHERRIKLIGATILPYGANGYYHPDAANEADRQAINSWIRAPGHFDALIDFDLLMRDPARPSLLRKEYDSGDGLHPSEAGYRAMGGAVPLSLFGGAGR